MDWTKKLTCLYCPNKIKYCGCTAEFFGPGHDEEHCVCDRCKKRMDNSSRQIKSVVS